MGNENFKIGYSDLGGIYIGKNIQSSFHQHHLIAIVLSYGEPFEITRENNLIESYRAVLIQKDANYKLITSEKDYVIFIHLDPYSEIGINLTQSKNQIQSLDLNLFTEILNDFKEWFDEKENSVESTENLINKIYKVIITRDKEPRKIDERIFKCIEFIKQSDLDKISIQQIASFINLSTSRLSHLFKFETGLTFRQFVLHRKLVKSLQVMYKQHNLTESSFVGGFSDQPHFTKTFKNAFGIKPSASKK